ncbi:MAG: hypothetical protein ABSF63_00195 [Candidatus Bathyarchaeia archaeon]|jgi:hypothetical protein
MNENLMKKLAIVVLLVGIVSGLYSQSVTGVFATSPTPAGHCHWWDPFCHKSSSPGYGQNSGYCSYNQYGSSYCYGSGSSYPSNCVTYACSYPSAPSYQYPSYPETCSSYQYQYCPSSPSYQYPSTYYPQQTSASLYGLVSSSNVGIVLQTQQGCYVTLLGGPNTYVTGYIGQYATVTGFVTVTSNGPCPYTSMTVTSITPVQQQIVQATTSTTPSITTMTVTQSPTTEAQVYQETSTDYGPILLIGTFVLLAIAMLGYIMCVMRKQSVTQPQQTA